MTNIILVFIGGGLGSVARYAATTFIKNLTPSIFPFGTLTVNILGSFIIGAVTSVLATKTTVESARLLITVGFLGGFTTFSSFSLDTLTLLGKHEFFYALISVVSNVSIGLVAAYLGFILFRH